MADVPPVSAVADVLSLRGLGGWLTPPLRPIVAPTAPLVGTAVTVALRATPAGRGLGELQRLLSTQVDGAVLVVAGGTGVGGAVWGEILSRAARLAGFAAVLIDGAVRDRDAMANEALPVLAASEAVVGPAGRVSVAAVDVDVTVGGFTVASGDVVLVDSSGAVRVEAVHAERVLADARRYADAEAGVLEELASGVALTEAYRLKQEMVEGLLGEVWR